MLLNRNEFLESLAKDSAGLHIIFLNHAGSPTSLQTDLSSIDLLADKKTTETFKNYCLSHKLVREIVVTHEFRRTRIMVSMNDGSQLYFKLVRNMIRQTLECLPVSRIKKDAIINDYGMLVPAPNHHFEYMLLKCQFGSKAFPDKFQKYFSALESKIRAELFVYLQTRYNLVFNTIEDLYSPTGKTQLKLIIGLRRLGRNTLSKMFFRSVNHLLWVMGRLFWKKETQFFAHHPSNANDPVKSVSKRHAEQAIL